MRLLPDFYQVGGPGMTCGNDATAFLLPAGETLWMVDCGSLAGYDRLLENIAQCASGKKVSRIFGTHGHYDHLGAAARFRRDFGTQLFLHDADKQQVESGDPVRTTAGLLYGKEFEACTVDAPLRDRDTFTCDAGELTVLHTPGHTQGSVCLHLHHRCGMQVLIAGDTLYGGSSPLIGSDEAAWRVSLDKLAGLHFDAFVFGHSKASLHCDADRRLLDLRNQFGTYSSPWFKDFIHHYTY